MSHAPIDTNVPAPPAYAEKDVALANVVDILQKSLTKESVGLVDEAMAKKIEDPSIREKIIAEVKVLGDIVVAIEKDFHLIGDVVHDIDTKNILSKAFKPEWDALHGEYTSLLLESKKSANEVKSKVNTLKDDLLPIIKNPEHTAEDKADALSEFILSLNTFSTDGTAIEKRYILLRQNVESFQKNIKEDAATQSVDVKNKIADVENKIAKLKKDIDDASGFFTRCWNVVSSGVRSTAGAAGGSLVAASGAVGGIAATAGIAALAPVASVGLLVAGIGALGFGIFDAVKNNVSDLEGKKANLAGLQRELIELQLKQEALKQATQQLNDLDAVFKDMTTKLASIQSIWHLLVSDAQTIKDVLEDVKVTKNKLMLRSKCERMETLWKALYELLDTFVLAVN